MTAPEVTPAVRRAAEALEDAALRLTGRDLGTIYRDRIAREGLAAGLDVETIARELFVADSWQDRDFVLHIWFQAPDDSAVKKHWRRIATALRAAILGPDVVWQGDGVRAVASNLVAVDEEGDE